MQQELQSLSSLFFSEQNSQSKRVSRNSVRQLHSIFLESSPLAYQLPNLHDFIGAWYQANEQMSKLEEICFSFLVKDSERDSYVLFSADSETPSMLSIRESNAFTARKRAAEYLSSKIGVRVEPRDFTLIASSEASQFYCVEFEHSNVENSERLEKCLSDKVAHLCSKQELTTISPALVDKLDMPKELSVRSRRSSRKDKNIDCADTTSDSGSNSNEFTQTDETLGTLRSKRLQSKFTSKLDSVLSKFDWAL